MTRSEAATRIAALYRKVDSFPAGAPCAQKYIDEAARLEREHNLWSSCGTSGVTHVHAGDWDTLARSDGQ